MYIVCNMKKSELLNRQRKEWNNKIV